MRWFGRLGRLQAIELPQTTEVRLRRQALRHMTRTFQRRASFKVTDDDKKRIYIQGTSSKALYYAYGLARHPEPPPITFLPCTNERVLQFVDRGGQVEIFKCGERNAASGFDMDCVPRKGFHGPKVCPGNKHLMMASLRLQSNELTMHFVDNAKDATTSPASGGNQNTSAIRKSQRRSPKGGSMMLSQIRPAEVCPPETKDHARLAPIMNLFLVVKSQHVVADLLAIRPRLQRDSTVIIVQPGLGLLEKIFAEVFPDPGSRPSFFVGLNNHLIWKAVEDLPFQSPKDRLYDMLSIKGLAKDASFSVNHAGDGSLKIGPLELIKGEETPGVVATRNRKARYFIQKLCESAELQTYEIPQRLSDWLRLKTLAVHSILGPLSVRYECKMKDIFIDETRKAEGLALLEEASRVLLTFNLSFTVPAIQEWLSHTLLVRGDDVHIMLQTVMDGKLTEIDDFNGWLVRQGQMHRPPILCPLNDLYVKFVKAKATERAWLIQEQREERWRIAAEKRELVKVVRQMKRQKQNLDRMDLDDKVEVKKLKKTQRQKEMSGKQPLPDYERPQIQSLGNSRIQEVRCA